MGSYEIEFVKSFERDIRSLPRQFAPNIVEKTFKLADEPRPPQVRKLRGTKNEYRLRVGDYRVFFTIDDDAHRIVVFHVAHRREAYR